MCLLCCGFTEQQQELRILDPVSRQEMPIPAPDINDQTGVVTLTLKGKVYKGHWLYHPEKVEDVRAFKGGKVSLIVIADDGSYLRCQFHYNEETKTGLGTCKDNASAEYDLMLY